MTKFIDSGFDWIGQIPGHWRVAKFRYVLNESKEVNGSQPVGEMLSVSQYRGIVPKEYENDSLRRTDEELENYRVVRPGQLVVNTMWLNHGGLAVSNLEGHVSPAYRAFRIRDDLESRYANYLMRSSSYVAGYTKFLTGVRPNSLQMSREDLMGFPLLVPPLDEQRRIADYLDRELAEIDALIAKQEQLITTLDERRGAVISRAVTRGLLEDRPFRDSGVEWLGEIPADWDVRPCWSSFRRVKQTGFSEEELLSVYRDHGVVPKSSRDDNHNVESEDLTSYQLVRVGDMVMNKMKAWQGSIALSDHRGIVSPAYFVYRPTQEFSRKYFHYLLRSAPYVAQYNRISKGVRVGQWDLDPTYFRTTSLIVPPVEEQRRIADFLDSETARFDQLRAEGTRMNRLLAERRQALISAAVTGKLEVGV